MSREKSFYRTQPTFKTNQKNKKITTGRVVKKASTQTLRRSARSKNKQAQPRSHFQ